ncbi:serine protease [Bacillus sp. AF23]|uniref:serine protease n=1 Tax=Bacillus sp. AF23 TaxID=2821151 RepID=UPI001E59A170|nr:serine protease [Bacillus sp. AF23]MCC8350742.1 serine protease [Bacillus sp. AF23]
MNFNETRGFAQFLEASGYKPLDIKYLLNKELKEGEDICLIGYPLFSDLGGLKPELSGYHLPIYSFGKVAMNPKDFDYLIGNIFNYGGFSGGPVIFNNKVIGIVSAQVVDKISDEIKTFIRYPMTYIKKTRVILQLFEKIRTNEEKLAP